MTDLESCLVGVWLHSHEEDSDGLQVYRPADYAFPPARGRDGFEFRPEGQLVRLGIAAGDGAVESLGRWVVDPVARSVEVDVQVAEVRPYTLAVVSCDAEVLKVRR